MLADSLVTIGAQAFFIGSGWSQCMGSVQ